VYSLHLNVFDLMTKWIERYQRLDEERFEQLDEILAGRQLIGLRRAFSLA
jgi:hypothetical protein